MGEVNENNFTDYTAPVSQTFRFQSVFCFPKSINRFHKIPAVNSDYLPRRHSLTGLCYGYGLCFIYSTDWMLTY
jgi:hypothetical protein